MTNARMRMALLAASIAATLAAPETRAVSLDADGLGQALIYPYYTVQSAGGNAFNTYLSVVNHAADAKAIRVRFREGRMSREAFSFNLFLAPHDTWTAGVVPTDAGARLLTVDVSCTDPPFATSGSLAYADFGQTTARPSCTGLVGADLATSMTATAGYTAPTGGLSGSLTLINVNNGQDFTLNAIALAELTTRPMYRSLADSASVDFNAPEVDPVSHVVADGYYYRSQWSRPVDAVSAVLMRAWWSGEVVLDTGTRSHSDLVSVFPTRQYYAANATACQPATINLFDRESVQYPPPDLPTQSNASLCSAVSVVSPANSGAASVPTAALGSMTAGASIAMGPQFQNGWLALEPIGPGTTLTSLASSTRLNLATGETTTGSHIHTGLPVVGLWVRTFENGTLSCNGIPCQGNYGGAFPLVSRRSVTPSP